MSLEVDLPPAPAAAKGAQQACSRHAHAYDEACSTIWTQRVQHALSMPPMQDSSSIPPSPEAMPSRQGSLDRLPESSTAQRTPLASKAPQQQQEASNRRDSPAATYYSEVCFQQSQVLWTTASLHTH